MVSELFIENKRLDISADISSLLTFAIDDVKDFASRSTTFSKTIVLPGTANNNKLFGHIFETGISNDYDSTLPNIGVNFNAAKSARAYLFQDNLQTFKGTIRMLKIVLDGKRVEYEMQLVGEISNLNSALTAALLEDLDFSAYDHTYNETNIVNSWDNAPGSGYYYPLMDYGNYSTLKHDWDIRTFRPALYVKEYLDKMFEAAGFRYESTLFETDRFKGLIVPHNQKKLQTLNTRLLSASRNDSTSVLDSGTAPVVALEFSSVVTSIFTPSAGDSRFTYTGSTTNLDLNLSFFGNYRGNTVGYTMVLQKNGVDIPGTSLTLPRTFDTTVRFFTWNATANVTLNNTDYIEAVFSATIPIVGTDFIKATSGNLFVDSLTAVATEVIYGETLQMNYSIPKNIRQVDFLVSIVKLFNLYVFESQFDDQKLFIEPYVDFYSTDSANAVDWTYKLNRDLPREITPLSELTSKLYNFNYQADSDFYNDLYKKRYNQTYGSYTYDSQYEFATQSTTASIIFAGTPLVGYAGEEKIYSTIFKKNNDIEENVDSVIRILQTKKITGVASWDILDGVTSLVSLTKYGYSGHLNDPDAPSDDLNFGALQELFFVLVSGDLSANQFNLYWSSYMAEITDKDSRMLKGKFYLTPKDIATLDFSKYVYVDGVAYRLNAIRDYNTTRPADCTAELLRVINTLY